MGTIHTSVAAVINMLDAVTEREILSGAVRLIIDQDNPVVWKNGVTAVILEKHGVNSLDISLESGIYRREKLSIELNTENKPQIYNVWLTPTENYPFTKDMKVVRGEGEKAKPLYMARLPKTPTIKLIVDTDQSEDIKIWGIEGDVRDRIILLKEDDISELAVIAYRNQEENDSYFLKEKPKHTFHKSKAQVYLVTRVMTGEDGKYIMAFRGLSEDEHVETFS